MSVIQITHIQKDCKTRFASLIDMSDVKTADSNQREEKFLSRALAAFAIAAIAKTDDASAAQSVVDEYGDDGIDAFFFNRNEHIAYLVQSKWIKSGTSTPDLASILKFIQGINHFLEDKLSNLGPKMLAKKADIEEVLGDSQATFVLIVAYTGKQQLAPDVAKPLSNLLSELNDDAEIVSLQILKQKELHDIVESGAIGNSVDLTIMLKEFGKIDAPYSAYYGHVDIIDLAPWAKYGDFLYHKNIRGFKGSTDVNNSIIDTIRTSPQHFVYFNNGITLLCSEINKQPLGGKSRESGVFDCKGVSVINGAQTVGSILTALSTPSPSDSALGANAQVMVRLISLQNCPQDFGNGVTRATNTQNRIDKRDFAALDAEQDRLRKELLLSLGMEYVYRTGDHPPTPDKGCTLEEATIALACAHADVTHAVNAKQAIGRFYEDTTKPPYTVLFNQSVTAIKLWHGVEILRAVDVALKNEQSQRDGKDKLCAIHGNRVILHLVFRELTGHIFENENIDTEVARIPALVTKSLNKMHEEIEATYSSSYVGNIFKNISKCKAIVAAVTP